MHAHLLADMPNITITINIYPKLQKTTFSHYFSTTNACSLHSAFGAAFSKSCLFEVFEK